jgi:hypothetical protein
MVSKLTTLDESLWKVGQRSAKLLKISALFKNFAIQKCMMQSPLKLMVEEFGNYSPGAQLKTGPGA